MHNAVHRARHLACGIAVVGLLLAARPVSAEPVAVVSMKSPVFTLSKTQVADIFLGKATRFPDGSRAVPIDQSEGILARDEFYADIVGKSPVQMKAYWSRIIFTGRGQPPKAASSSAAVKILVSADPNAIGYIESRMVDATLRVVAVTAR